MANYDGRAGTPQFQGHSDTRLDRGVLVSWTGVFAGTAMGWGLFSLLALVAAAIGFAKFDPYSIQPARGIDVGSSIFGVVTMVLASFVGSYLAIRIAGHRRRNEALVQGGLCWALSMLLGAMLALSTARAAATTAAAAADRTVDRTSARATGARVTDADRDRADDAAAAAAKASGAGAGAAFIALVMSLLGALAAARSYAEPAGAVMRKRDTQSLPGAGSFGTPAGRDDLTSPRT